MHEKITNKGSRTHKRYKITGEETNPSEAILASLTYAEVTHDKKTITLICESLINTHGEEEAQASPKTMNDMYDKLPNALKRMSGRVHLPPDGGKLLLEKVKNKNSTLLGVSDASLCDNQCSHAWIICSGEPEDLSDPNMHVSGEGIVDGAREYLSSTRGELQGQAALTVMTSVLLQANDTLDTQIKLVGDNKGVQMKTSKAGYHKIHHHREANSDLFLEYYRHAQTINRKVAWVKGHQDDDTPWETIKELKELKLSPEATMNIWCEKRAEAARQNDITIPDAEVLPAEKWALYSTYPQTKKNIGNITEEIIHQLQYEAMENYIRKKHGICKGMLKDIYTEGLRNYIGKLKPHQ